VAEQVVRSERHGSAEAIRRVQDSSTSLRALQYITQLRAILSRPPPSAIFKFARARHRHRLRAIAVRRPAARCSFCRRRCCRASERETAPPFERSSVFIALPGPNTTIFDC
jgi:hypothetical protein